jgi:hypothetical protein
MNLETIQKNTLANQTWLERALIVLDKNNLWHNEIDRKTGSYMASWVRSQRDKGVKLGECLTGDVWTGRARHLVQGYARELLALSLQKAKNDAERYKNLAAEARKRVRQFQKAIEVLERGENKKEAQQDLNGESIMRIISATENGKPLTHEQIQKDLPKLERIHEEETNKSPSWGVFGGVIHIENRTYQVA